jgi:hypothetical protein
LSKHRIIAKKQSDPDTLKFQVTIEEASGRTTHIITIKDSFLGFLPKNHSEEEIVIAVFRFLLDREPKEAILTNFDISIIQNYFPKFLSEISPYLCKIKN